MSTLERYFHTIRHLRPIQIAARARLLLTKPRLDLRAAPSARELTGSYVEPVALAATLLGPDLFRFQNVERLCSLPADWEAPDAAKLWLYNLHYFDDLNALGAAQRAIWHRTLLERWVREVAPGEGQGWEPYPLSRRIVNWVKWAVRRNPLPLQCHSSLAVQARWLLSRLEYHILGNHLFVNAKALVHAGLYFTGPEADRWYARGMEVLARELREQVLADGGHFELSPMYHAAALEDLLDLINVLRAFGRSVPSEFSEAVEGMRRWLAVMSHPDGEIAFFNDAAFDVAPTKAELDDYAARLALPALAAVAEPLITLAPSGYVRAAAGAACLICDCAQVGPDYLPGHAHADTLSFELSLGRQRVLVNSGTSEYGLGAERLRQRGTAAHNTVVLDGQDSSEVWSGFRVARRARARLLKAAAAPVPTVEASHDGYRRLPGRSEHRRRWALDAKSLWVEDHIDGAFRSAEARFHSPPGIDVQQTGSDEVSLRWSGDGMARMVFDGAVSVHVFESTWHPRFGESLPSRGVVARFAGQTLRTRVSWEEAV